MSYGPLDMYRNPGSSGPQLRDFNSIIQTCSGNIQRISQASELGVRDGGQGLPRGQARVRLSGCGAWPRLWPKPYLRPSSGSPVRGRRLPSFSMSGPGSPRVPSPSWSLSFFSGVLPSWYGGQSSSLTALGWEGYVCHLGSSEWVHSAQWSAEFFLSSALPPPTSLSSLASLDRELFTDQDF